MNFKKYGIVYLLVFFVIVAFGLNLLPNNIKSLVNKNQPIATIIPEQNKEGVTVIINDGKTPKTYENLHVENAYAALVEGAKLSNLEIKTKQYDFGIFVEQIGDLKNSNDLSWIYYVNDKSGDVAGDKKTVVNGDKVEWKYEKPNF